METETLWRSDIQAYVRVLLSKIAVFFCIYKKKYLKSFLTCPISQEKLFQGVRPRSELDWDVWDSVLYCTTYYYRIHSTATLLDKPFSNILTEIANQQLSFLSHTDVMKATCWSSRHLIKWPVCQKSKTQYSSRYWVVWDESGLRLFSLSSKIASHLGDTYFVGMFTDSQMKDCGGSCDFSSSGTTSSTSAVWGDIFLQRLLQVSGETSVPPSGWCGRQTYRPAVHHKGDCTAGSSGRTTRGFSGAAAWQTELLLVILLWNVKT